MRDAMGAAELGANNMSYFTERRVATLALWAIVTAYLMHRGHVANIGDLLASWSYCAFAVNLPRGWFE